MKLKNKIAIVTGGTLGIGEAIAREFAREGAQLIILGRNTDRGTSVCKDISSEFGVKTEFYQIDLNDSSAIKKTMDDIIKKYSNIDILVNNAGIATQGTVESLDEEQWDAIFRVNVKAPYLICKYIVPVMRNNGSGSIINIGSSAGLVGAWGLHAYSATKGAIIQLTKSMAAQYAKENIRVNALCPGATATPLLDNIDQEFIKMIPMQRMANPIEIAKGAVFLASGDSSFMTGANLVIDGGFTAI
ncbi:MAG: SDR family NAD(P)-dependent oxidoreductase [Firmicutes bacterium]|nr:SDR family NAD(P)-dependent oxidoreductase [Bacillota bacterium]